MYRALIAVTLFANFVLPKDRPGGDKQCVTAELQRLRGTWKLIRAEHDGREEPISAGTRLVIVERKLYLVENNVKQEGGDIALQPDKTPRWFDITATNGVNKGKVCRGIYELRGKRLTLCHTQAGRERPSAFSSRGQLNLLLLEKVEE